MARINELREPAAPQHSIHFDFWPWDEYTQCRVYVRSLVGGVGREVVVWDGNVGVGRRDLAGRSSADCAVMLSDHLYREWAHRNSDSDTDQPLGSGVPLGTTGGTVSQGPLPGM